MSLEFRRCDSTQPPASNLIEAVLAEYDAVSGRRLQGGPSASPEDFSSPRGTYLVGFLDDVAVCGGGIKHLVHGIAELKRMYVSPSFRGRGLAQDLLRSLEDTARELGYHTVRLDSWRLSRGLYEAAGYREIPDYNNNPHADFWGEKRL